MSLTGNPGMSITYGFRAAISASTSCSSDSMNRLPNRATAISFRRFIPAETMLPRLSNRPSPWTAREPDPERTDSKNFRFPASISRLRKFLSCARSRESSRACRSFRPSPGASVTARYMGRFSRSL